jgi:hypothetical protein
MTLGDLIKLVKKETLIASIWIHYISMVSTTRSEKLGITLPKSLLRTIDGKRGDVPRSTYIRRAVEDYLKRGRKDV